MSKPVVAVVGRPNVGKSTLFNALAGSRISIVEDTPGVTRDRIYAEVSWLDYQFTLIDTGGIEPESDDIIISRMREQAETAIMTADVILFLVDVRQGLVDADFKVADMLRRSHRPVVLVVNKVDNFDKFMPDVYEFYNLGLGDPIPVSAQGKLGIGDMLDQVVEKFEAPVQEEEEEDDRPKIAVIGKPNAGKSSFLNALLGEERAIVTDIAGTTRDTLEESVTIDGITLNIVDTAGIRDTEDKVESIGVERAKKEIESADLILFLMDTSVQISEEDIEILQRIRDKKKIILLNKSDKATEESGFEQSALKEYISEETPVISISAKYGDGIDNFIMELKNMMFHGRIDVNQEVYITNARHKDALAKTYESLECVERSIEAGMPEDFFTIDLMNAYEKLGLIIGESVEEDLVNEIFSKFCTGK